MKKKLSLKKLKKKADDIYSKKLRLKFSDDNGNVKCFTCSTIKNWKEIQCGHYITRKITILRYDPRNTRPQCVGCNMFNQGRLDVFAFNLVREYGSSILEELQLLKLKTLTGRETRELLEEIINNP